MKKHLLLFLFITLGLIAFSQQDTKQIRKDIKKPYKLNDFSFHYSGSIYNFRSTDLTHIHDLYSFSEPNWSNIDSMISHENRSELNARINFQKQLYDKTSYFYGNISIGICVGLGNRISGGYVSDYFSHADTATLNSIFVTNIDTLTIMQNEYLQNTTDLGFEFAYTISSPPKNVFTGEFGIGVSCLYSVINNIYFTDSYSQNTKYLDQYNRIQSFEDSHSDTEKFKGIPELFFRIYVPLILSYKLDRAEKFALTTMFTGGFEFQKPKNAKFYTYPYFTIGIGFRYFF
jgi:hypothetical protein